MTRCKLALLVVALAPAGCFVSFDDDAPVDGPGLDALVRLDDEPAGERCPAGGVVVVVGTDADEDGALDPEEESAGESVVCAGAAGAPAKVVLLRISEEPEGEACPHAGQRVESGIDDDADDLLDDEEVERTRTLCNGAPGGEGGQALVEVSEEPPGEQCAGGGAKVASGIDQDGDAALDEEEVAATAYACDGGPGSPGAPGADGSDALVDVSSELPGLACPAGGQRVSMGLDLDADGVLDEEERSSSSYICNGRSLSSGGGGELSGGSAEGTVAAPVALSVGSFAADDEAHGGNVGAGLVSYYRFTTLADAAGDASGPYTLAFHDVEADVAVAVYAGADFSTDPQPIDCVFEGPRLYVCGTGTLSEGTAYYASVTETRNVALDYTLTVSFGARTGTTAAPATPAMSVSVHGGGSSVFAIGGAPGDVKTVRLRNVRGAPGATPALVWDQLDDGTAQPPYGTCATDVAGDIACPTARLLAGTLIGVRDTAGAGAVFDLIVEDGDTITPQIPLESFEEIPAPLGVTPIVAVPTAGAGSYTLGWREASGGMSTPYVLVYPDRFSADAGARYLAACTDDCVITLPDAVASGLVYLRAPARTSGDETPHSVALYPWGGAQGEMGAPHALPVGSVVRGSLAGTSYYALPAPSSETRYAVRVDSDFDVPMFCRWHDSETFSLDSQLYANVQSNVNVDGCISEPLPAGAPAYLALSASFSHAVAYTLEVLEGDALTPVVTMAGGVVTVVGENVPTYHQLTPLAPGPYEIVTTTTGSVRRRVFPGWPRNFLHNQNVVRCEGSSQSSSSSSACTLRFVAKQSVDTYYVELFPFAYTITLDPVAVPVETHVLDTPATYTISADGVLWLEVDVTSAGAYALDITQAASGSYSLRVYGPGYEELVHQSSVFSGAGSLVTRDLGALTPGRWAISIDPSGSTAVEVTVDVREVP